MTASYPEYRRADVEWLDVVPSHWNRVPIRHLFRRVKRTGFGNETLLSVYRDYGVIEKASRADNFNNASEDLDAYQLVEPGDLAINKMKAWQGSVAISTIRGIVSPAYFIYRPSHDADPRFLHFLFRSGEYISAYALFSKGVRINQWDLDPEQHLSMTVNLPPLDEQRQIAEYLDRETGKIDELIAKQELLVEVLTERRDATILQGVTRGLDHAVVMKESPAAWTPEIPAHWSGGNIRRFALMKTGHTPSRTRPEYWEDCNTPWFTLADVWQLRKGQRFMGDTAEKVSAVGLANSAAELLPKGTVVLSRTASVGFIGIMPRPMATSQDYWNWVPGPKLNSEYLYLQLLAMRPHLMSLMRGSTHKTIYQSTAASLSLVVPPLEEQRAIVEAVDQEMAKGAALIETASRAMALLRERRSALISAAVTGKIDVRNSSTKGDVT
jgi:type I restriction enzyme S subunit